MYSHTKLEEKAATCSNKKKILIVDDEKDVLLVLKRRLITMGFSVSVADNGNDALVLASSERPDLIILDVLMPSVDGLEVARKLEKIPETMGIPVIFLTGIVSNPKGQEQGRIVFGNMLFDKPYDIEQLLLGINKALSEKKNISSLKKESSHE